ncbi:acyl-CoA N-acyltransferase [Xylariaceae sp. FL0016]|nr:acyl-CoA N-acyltransferase [Xylariaceae sp. FL0016]
MASPPAPRPIIRTITAAETHALRHQVLWPHKSLSYVQLPDDDTGQHFGAFVHDEHHHHHHVSRPSPPVSIISLFIDDSGEARFRKFATAPSWQGRGLGSALLAHAIAAARAAGAATIWCDARESARGFYGRFGLEAEGGVFYKGEVAYRRMRRSLS